MWTVALVVVVGQTRMDRHKEDGAAAAARRGNTGRAQQSAGAGLKNLGGNLASMLGPDFHTFRKLDADLDGKLNASEWMQHKDHHPESFEPHEAVDANSDGHINLTEAKEYFKLNPGQVKPRARHDEL